VSGFEGQFRNIFDKPFSVTNYWTSYLLILLMGILINLDNFRKFAKKNAIPLMFTILYFTGYLIAFAWYCPIACGRRFPFALYIPFLIAAFLAINELAKNQNRESGKVENQINLTRFFTASNVIVAITLIFNIWLVTNNVLFFDFFGS
jgi:hypothetical protein